MFKKFHNQAGNFIALVSLIFIPACARIQTSSPSTLPPVQEISTQPAQVQIELPVTSTLKIVPSLSTQIDSTPPIFPVPKIKITAVKGNLFIRRGPDMAFNPIGVLYKGKTLDIIGRDVLTKWVQVILPNSKNTGWISVKTDYSEVIGDLSILPDFTPTLWPVPAYIRNCSHHEMYIQPGEITLPSSFNNPNNEIWLYPGKYTVYDLEVTDYPAVMDVTMREGLSVDILFDGLGEKRKCP
jgi:hypothetical protein